jgi:hypothetical protein
MLGHHDIAINVQSIITPHSFYSCLKDSAAYVRYKQPTAVIAAECDEMTLTTLLKTCESPGHEDNLVRQSETVCDV